MEVEVAILGSPSLAVALLSYGLCGRKAATVGPEMNGRDFFLCYAARFFFIFHVISQ